MQLVKVVIDTPESDTRMVKLNCNTCCPVNCRHANNVCWFTLLGEASTSSTLGLYVNTKIFIGNSSHISHAQNLANRDISILKIILPIFQQKVLYYRMSNLACMSGPLQCRLHFAKSVGDMSSAQHAACSHCSINHAVCDTWQCQCLLTILTRHSVLDGDLAASPHSISH